MAIALLTPAKIGTVEIKNRVIISSMCLYYSNKNGDVTDKMIAFFEKRAKAGIGAFIIPANPHGENKRARGSLADDSRIEQWKPLLETLHKYDAKAFNQIHPSGIQFGRVGFNDSPFDVTTEGIEKMIESYAQGALRAKKAGFDGVEIHGAHGHEVALLISELLNTRKDKYGGSLENCARNITEMISRIKELCGRDFPVILRISGEERIPGGREIANTAEICKLAQASGVDAVHVSSGMPQSEEWECPPSEINEGHLAYMGRYLKERLDIPVIVVGRIVHWETGEEMIKNGDADFVAMARTSLADGEWMRSVGDNEYPVRHCIACNQGCRTRREQNKTMCECLQNPLTGREELIDIKKDCTGKKVCVIGAGVAGLEAANVLSKRGCNVAIYESRHDIGGLFRFAGMAPGKARYMDLLEYYRRILSLQDVTLNCDAELTQIPDGVWDLVVLSTGGKNIDPPIKKSPNAVIYAPEIILTSEPDKSTEYVVVGDGMVGYEVADYLSQKGSKVIVVGNDPRAPEALQGIARWNFMKKRFEETGVNVIRHSTVSEINENYFVYANADGVETRCNGSFMYVLACGYVVDKENLSRFIKDGQKSIVVGNADKSGDAMDAIHGAFEKALSITL